MNQARRFSSSSVPARRTPVRAHATLGVLILVLGFVVACPVAFAQPAGVAASPGPVWAWGSNSYGQLGIGDDTNSDVPVADASAGDGSLADVSGGEYHTLAVDSNGDVWAWGQDTYGQLGDGPTSGTTVSSEYPIDITQAAQNASTPPSDPIGAVQQVAAGGYFSLALDDNGNVWAWGENNDDQLGISSSTSQETWPLEETSSNLSNVVQVAAGQQSAYALRSDGTVWAWGNNSSGELGNAYTTNESTPQEVCAVGSTSGSTCTAGYLSNVIAIAAAGQTAYALEANGTVVAWGDGYSGQLGNGTTTSTQDVPVAVSSLTGITAIAGGGSHALAVGSGGDVYAWGDDSNGQLGNSSTTNSDTPVQVEGLGGSGYLSGVQSVAAGDYYSLALTDSGSVYAWGYNGYGQLGNGNTTDVHYPVEVTNIGENDGAAAISAGDQSNQSFIIGQPAISLSSSQVEFAPGQVGHVSSSSAVTITDTGDAPLDVNFTDLVGQDADSFQISGDSCSGTTLQPEGTAASDLTSCTIGLRQDAAVAGPLSATLQISQNLASLYTNLPLAGAGLPAPASGLAFSISPASIFATGSDSNGQLGAGNVGGTFVDTAVGVQPSALSFVQVSAGGTDSLGLRPDGTVWAWGGNSSGQLGIDSSTDSWALSQVPLPGAAVAVSAGGSHSLAIEQGGTVWAWGSNTDGQLGNGTTTSSNQPVQVPGLVNIVAVSAGGTHSLALQANGTVWAWGNNASGQLGIGSSPTQEDSPVQITGLPSNIVAISAGGSHSLALTSSGTIYAWGLGTSGQLGNGSNSTSDTPVEVSSITTAVAIASGNAHSVALLANGTVDAWGLNSSGQLGNGGTTSSDTPVSVSGLPSGITQIAGGYAHSAAMTATGEVYAWGLDSSGQLGTGNTTSQDTATEMSGVNDGGAGLGTGSQANHTLFIAQAYASPSATTLVFSSESPGDDSSSLTETITNDGLIPLVIGGQDNITGADGDQFKITGDGCAGTTVQPGGTCVIGVRYEALVSGSPDATLRINSNSPTSPTLITLDPPAPKSSGKRILCHKHSRTHWRVTLSCSGQPSFPRSGFRRVRLDLDDKIIVDHRVRVHLHQVIVRFRARWDKGATGWLQIGHLRTDLSNVVVRQASGQREA